MKKVRMVIGILLYAMRKVAVISEPFAGLAELGHESNLPFVVDSSGSREPVHVGETRPSPPQVSEIRGRFADPANQRDTVVELRFVE
jgi:hypothetical protein